MPDDPREEQRDAVGMVERFNGRISEVVHTTQFRSAEHRRDTMTRYVRVYN